MLCRTSSSALNMHPRRHLPPPLFLCNVALPPPTPPTAKLLAALNCGSSPGCIILTIQTSLYFEIPWLRRRYFSASWAGGDKGTSGTSITTAPCE